MIPYEELVAALAGWRERNGLPVGAADYLGEPPVPPPVTFASYEEPAAAVAPEGGEWAGEDVELSADDAIIGESETAAAEDMGMDVPAFAADEAFAEAPIDEAPVDEIPMEEAGAEEVPIEAADDAIISEAGAEEVPIEAADDAIISEAADDAIISEADAAIISETDAAIISETDADVAAAGADPSLETADETAPVDIGDVADLYPAVDDEEPPAADEGEVAFISSPPPTDMEVGDATDVHHVAPEGPEAATVDQANYPIESEETSAELDPAQADATPEAAPDPNDPNSPFEPIDEES